MLTGDFPIPENSDQGPDALRNITPYLDLAEQLGAPLLRVCLKTDEDIAWARRAADEAAERDLRLAHQCHTPQSLRGNRPLTASFGEHWPRQFRPDLRTGQPRAMRPAL